jgi:hypothetical protein
VICHLALAACGSEALHVDANHIEPSDAGCDRSQVPLIVAPDRLHVRVDAARGPAVLLVDTGSPTTFLQLPLGSPDPVHHAGMVTLGCDTLDLDGRPEAAEPAVMGLPAIGTFGADRLLAGPSELDLPGQRIVFHDPGQPFPEAATWPAAGFDTVLGLVLAHASLDGTPVRLMMDTGSQHTLWLGQQPKPGDVEVDTTDADGHVVRLYLGTATLAIGDWQGSVTVLRAPSFPYLEGTITALGGNVQGLLGLSSLGTRVVVDADSGLLRVGR